MKNKKNDNNILKIIIAIIININQTKLLQIKLS